MRLEALGQFEVALVESRVAPTGPLDAPAWVAYWRDLHANFRDGTCCFDMPVQWAGSVTSAHVAAPPRHALM